MKRAFLLLGTGLLGLAALLVVRALLLPSRQVEAPPPPPLAFDEAAAVERLAAGLRFETVSYQDAARFPADTFDAFQRWLAATYPRLHATLRQEKISGHALLYTWSGRDPGSDAVVLLAHQDVVPIVARERWSRDPFGGEIAGGFVWGRGAMDDKGSLLAICEAVERLLADGFEPARNVHLAFGHDEEVGGEQGAGRIAAQLAARGVRAFVVLDEGSAVLDGVVPGVDRPVAPVAVAEKGYVTLELTVAASGGHSSMPPPHTAVGILASAIHRIERAPLPAGLRGVVRQQFEWLAPEMGLAYRIPLANLWLFEPLLVRYLDDQPGLNALLRTTTAATMFAGSEKENVLPSAARAAVNFRILPGDTSDFVREWIRRVVDDERVEISTAREPREPSAVSTVEGPAFTALRDTIAEHFPGAIVTPGLTLGGTDARHYTELGDAVYRFVPFRFGPEDLGRAHGIDERLAVASYVDGIRFYLRLIERMAGAAPGGS